MNFAFLVHPLGNETDRVLGYLREVDLQRSFGWDMPSFFHDLHLAIGMAKRSSSEQQSVGVIDEFSGLKSHLSASADGRLYEIPMNSFAILEDPDRALNYMIDAVQSAAKWGAKIVGLGAMTGIVGGQGTYLAERSPIPVTTGNSLTVYAAVTNLMHACHDVGIDLASEDVAIIGVPGSIATAAARILRSRCRSLILVARQASPRAAALAAELDVELMFDIPAALARTRVVLSATSSGGCIDQAWLLPGTILSDVGVPTDTMGQRVLRNDVLILSGGICKVPDTMPLTSHYLWFHRGSMAACVAETVVLALDDDAECLSLGRSLDTVRIERIGQRAEAHGFDFSRLFSFGQPLGDSMLAEYRKAVVKQVHRDSSSSMPTMVELGREAPERFRRHINPVMQSLGGKLVKTFVRGEGVRVWDVEGKCYLDFLAGYGALNLGHNPPEVVAAVESALLEHAPGFSPAAINPLAAALAERLAAVAPAGLEMVFFGNSGAEAVEASLKLARRATGRHGFLYCDRSYHGKTLGALSVTGNMKYQRPFGPLVPECSVIPYGDLEALETALSTRQFAAFVVEPIQAEGGMNVPPVDYLKRTYELCRKAGTLLVVDEVQTGLGRTGRMFAVEHSGIEPDVMTLAKSLGGGLVPIGAMLTRRDLWLKAYGSLESFALHTSTFGGGSLAGAAGLATLQALRSTDVIANARERGYQILDGLRGLAKRRSIIKDVRGQGLLIGLEFNQPSQAMTSLWQGLLSGGAAIYLVPGMDDILDALTATYVMTLLMQEHGIYTQVARSNPRVLRIEPPLIVSEREAKQFLRAVEECCEEVEAAYQTFEQMVAKAVLGKHGDEQRH